jgi:A/G-specific adenine glycosylase
MAPFTLSNSVALVNAVLPIAVGFYNRAMSAFARKLVSWQKKAGRHDLPWQRTRDPYRVWLSEIMLQQTQVSAVLPYYERFLARFPDVDALAAADQDEVLRLWSGLGYYARARNLHAAARVVAARGAFPDTVEDLQQLPGVGRSTAGAIAAFCFGRRAAILDGNVKRVLARSFGVPSADWALAESLLPLRDADVYAQALMDLGATVCTRTRPDCTRCPVRAGCVGLRENRIDELPARTKKKPLPVRKAAWLVLLHAGDVLLERRASPGLWGGLWTFPEFPPGKLPAHVHARYGCSPATLEKLPRIEHGFTHFKLQAQPLLCRVKRRTPQTRPEGLLWISLPDALGAAIPVPVRKVLQSLGAS